MYDELVKRLHKRIALTTAGSPLQDDLKKAADAIEELSKLNAEITKRELKLRMEKPHWMPLPEPPKEDE